MKQLIKIIFLFSIILSCNMEKKSNSIHKTIPDFTKTFEGNIDGKYKIIMTLSKNENELIGTYLYKDKGLSIKIKGTIDSIGNLRLNEFNDIGNITGIFIGQLDNEKIIGEWKKPDETVSLPYYLTITNHTEAEFKYKHKIEWKGLYRDEFNQELNIYEPGIKGVISFQLIGQVNEYCTGNDINGQAYISNNTANFYEYGCKLKFIYNSDNSITIKESNCSHGASCGGFFGKYRKIDGTKADTTYLGE